MSGTASIFQRLSFRLRRAERGSAIRIIKFLHFIVKPAERFIIKSVSTDSFQNHFCFFICDSEKLSILSIY